MGRELTEITRIATVLCAFAFVVWASDRSGVPAELPPIALGWTLLLHVERAAALLGAIGIVVLVGWRALRGDFPNRLGQVEYQVERTAAEAQAIMGDVEARVSDLELLVRRPAQHRRGGGNGRD